MDKNTLTDEMISNVACPLCGSEDRIYLFETFDHEYKTTEIRFPLNECTKCGTKYLSPRPNLNSLDIIYPDSYNNFSISEAHDQSYVRRISNRIQAARIKNLISNYYSKKSVESLNILDVGCGDGYILDRVKEAFPGSNTYGVEPNHKAANIASKRHHVFEGVFESYKADIPFDIIFSSHVIEHVEQPIDFLGRIKQSLKEDGIVVIDTPNIDCMQYQIFKNNWGGIHAPRHWTLFDKKTLRLACEKVGFKVITVIEMPINIYWVWSLHSLLCAKGKNQIANKYFGVTDCVSKKSFYYLALMIFAELIERVTGFFGQGLGQQRMVLRK